MFSVKAVRISVKAAAGARRNACVSKNAQWLRPSRSHGLTFFSILSRQVYGMNQACNHRFYLSAKFGALNQRINEIRFSENQRWPLRHSLTLRFAKPLTLWASGCLTWLQCFLGHHRPTLTTVYMPPLPCMQAALERSSNPKLTLGREYFIKQYVLLLWLLLSQC